MIVKKRFPPRSQTVQQGLGAVGQRRGGLEPQILGTTLDRVDASEDLPDQVEIVRLLQLDEGHLDVANVFERLRREQTDVFWVGVLGSID